MIYYTTPARKSAQESIDKCINSINQIPENYLDSLTATKIVMHLLDLKKYIEKEDKIYGQDPFATENAIREEEGLEPLESTKLTSDNTLDDTYSKIRDFINSCKEILHL